MVLDLEMLPQVHKRKFVPAGVDLGDWSQAERYFADLQVRPISSAQDLKSWLEGFSELFGAFSEVAAARYIRMTGQTDDEVYRQDYLTFVEEVAPKAKVAEFNLNRKLAASPYTRELAGEGYQMMMRRVENRVRLFREESVELEKVDEKLGQEYESVTGAMTVLFEGKERTMSEMGRYLDEQDRATREQAWRLAQGRRLRDREKIDEIFEKMLVVRGQVASNAGFENFRDYSFLNRERFDYSPADCLRFHEAVEKHVVPIARKVNRRRQETLKLDQLRPWDTAVDELGRPPLNPFKTTEELTARAHATLEKVDPAFGRSFQTMVDLNLFDLASHPGKAPGGYSAELSDHMLPFIFMNSAGRDQDVWTLLHESGHALHVFETRDKGLPYYYRGENLPSEIAEVASMSMELMASSHMKGTFYDEADAERSRNEHFRSILGLLPWIATIDAFQHWVYTHPGHTLEERRDAWVRTDARFNTGESWDGLEEERGSYWHRQLHIFMMPFYYIEYGIAQLGALGTWSRYQKDPAGAVEAYRSALSLGASRPLPELFAAAGLPWDFGESIVKRYAEELRQILLD